MVCLSQQSAGSVWELAARQHGVVGYGQLRAMGLSRQAIRHRVARGRLHPLRRGVYAVGRNEVGVHGRWMAAVLAGGDGAFLTHGSAVALWGIRSAAEREIEVAVPGSSDRGGRGIRVRRRTGVVPTDITHHRDIPVTAPVLTLIDIACGLGHAGLERAVNEADRLDLIDPETLRSALDLERYRGLRGVARLRATLDRSVFRLTDSELERRFLPLAAQAGLPVP